MSVCLYMCVCVCACMFVHKCVFITMCQVSTGVVYMKEHNPAHYGMCRQGKWQSRDLLYSSQPTLKTTFINQVGVCIRLKKKKKTVREGGDSHLYSSKLQGSAYTVITG